MTPDQELSFHRSLCKRVDCPTCDGREADMIGRLMSTWRPIFFGFDSTVQPGRRMTEARPLEWDINVLMEELAEDSE